MNSAVPAGAASGTSRPGRRWLAAGAAVLAVACLVPPVAALAGRYVVAETVQFTVFAVVIPALLVLSGMWPRPGRPGQSRPRPPSWLRSVTILVTFGLVVVVWRLPVSVDAVGRHPALAVAELVTLVAAGAALWREIVAGPPGQPRSQDLARAVIAAFAMWLLWVIAYILGFANHGVFHAFRYAPGGPLSAVADQELATGVMWLVAGACFLPVIFAAALRGLRDTEDMDAELDRAAGAAALPAVRGWGEPRRGRARSAGGPARSTASPADPPAPR